MKANDDFIVMNDNVSVAREIQEDIYGIVSQAQFAG